MTGHWSWGNPRSGDMETADAAIFVIDWLLARDPLRHSWELQAGSSVRIAWVRPYLSFPAVYLSFEFREADQICVIQHARRSNVAANS